MNKLAQPLILAASVLLIGGGAAAAWLLRDHLSDAPRPARPADYDAAVLRMGGDEPAVRDELNALMSGASADLDPADAEKAAKLTRECLDPTSLTAIAHVRSFLRAAGRGEPPAYHFVGSGHRARLEAVAGPRPTPERVLAVRKGLAKVGAAFGAIREAPDWGVKIEGTPPPLPFLELLREAHQFRPAVDHPDLRPDPRVPTFAAADAELLAQLDQYLNTPTARAAFPPARYPKLYKAGRIPPLPTALLEYKTPVGESVGEEKGYLLPGADPDPEAVEAVNDVYARLERFFSAVVSFDQ